MALEVEVLKKRLLKEKNAQGVPVAPLVMSKGYGKSSKYIIYNATSFLSLYFVPILKYQYCIEVG